MVWPRVILCHFHILASKYVDFVLFSRAMHSTCDIIPKLSINMETYPHLVSSQMPRIYDFIIYLYSKTIVLCNILTKWLYLRARKQTSPGYIYGTLVLSLHTHDISRKLSRVTRGILDTCLKRAFANHFSR